jgi:acyl-coenzyme A synthetase/AMP-(fatty) acid ligase
MSLAYSTLSLPLFTGTSELEALDAIDQFHATHLILFEDVEAPGVSAAFTKYANSGNAQLHHARINRHPGQFEFTSATNRSFSSLPKLSNPETGCCLLLRTSGTTAKPKGVSSLMLSLMNV